MKPAPPVMRKENSVNGFEWKGVSYKAGYNLQFTVCKEKETTAQLIFEWREIYCQSKSLQDKFRLADSRLEF